MEIVVLPMTLEEIADAVGGSVHDADRYGGDRTRQYDSRLLEPGARSWPSQGRTSMGTILRRVRWPRAVAVLAGATRRCAGRRGRRTCRQRWAGLASVLVDRADGDLALSSAVTGSVGKTTTKHLLGQTLGRLGRTVAPPGNLNNEIGLPTTVSRIDPDTATRYAS